MATHRQLASQPAHYPSNLIHFPLTLWAPSWPAGPLARSPAARLRRAIIAARPPALRGRPREAAPRAKLALWLARPLKWPQMSTSISDCPPADWPKLSPRADADAARPSALPALVCIWSRRDTGRRLCNLCCSVLPQCSLGRPLEAFEQPLKAARQPWAPSQQPLFTAIQPLLSRWPLGLRGGIITISSISCSLESN